MAGHKQINPMMKNQTILITGGTGLLGSQLVEYFLSRGLTTIFTSRNKQKIDSTLKDKFHAISVDHEEKDSTDTIVSYLLQNNIWPDTLVNNAINLKYQFIDPDTQMTRRVDWLGEFLMDVVVPYELSYKLAVHKKSSLKRIINISSMYGIVARHPDLYLNPDRESPIQYGVVKAALIHLTKELAIRLASKGVQVNSVSFGGVEGRVDEAFKNRYAKLSPMGRMLKKEEITGAVEFLASEASVGMTGHNLVVDGGWTIW